MDPLGAMVDECDLPVLCFALWTDFLIYFFDGALSDGIGRFPSPKSKRSMPAGTRPSSTSPLPRRGTALPPVCRSGSAATIAILRCAAMLAGKKRPAIRHFESGEMIQSKMRQRVSCRCLLWKNEPQSESLDRIAENLTKNRRFSLSVVRCYAIMDTENKFTRGTM